MTRPAKIAITIGIILVLSLALSFAFFLTSPNSGEPNKTATQTSTAESVSTLTQIQFQTTTETVVQLVTDTTTPSTPASIRINGTVNSEDWSPIQVNFCAEAKSTGVSSTTVPANVATGTVPCSNYHVSYVQNVSQEKQTFSGSNGTYVGLQGTYSVVLPNDADYVLQVALTESHYGPSLIEFAGWLPLNHTLTQTTISYDIFCYYAQTNPKSSFVCAGSG